MTLWMLGSILVCTNLLFLGWKLIVSIANMAEATYHQERKSRFLSFDTKVLKIVVAKWELYYSARAAYGPAVASFVSSKDSDVFPSSSPLDSAFWHNLTEVFEIDNNTFDHYIDRMARSAWSRHCNERCRNNTICDMRAMRAENSCVSSA